MRYPSCERLRQLLAYDPETGEFWWKAGQKGASVGARAGSVNKRHGYRYIAIDGTLYRASRLAWLYMYGEVPSGQIDHIDRDRANDRISNLRSATQSQNNANTGMRSDNTSGYRGVCWHRPSGRWFARLKKDRRQISLGYFRDAREAARAYDIAAQKMFGNFASLNFPNGQ